MGNKRNLSSPHIPDSIVSQEGMGEERLVEREFSSLFTKFLPLFHDSLYVDTLYFKKYHHQIWQ